MLFNYLLYFYFILYGPTVRLFPQAKKKNYVYITTKTAQVKLFMGLAHFLSTDNITGTNIDNRKQLEK